jgi:hypothetical protein
VRRSKWSLCCRLAVVLKGPGCCARNVSASRSAGSEPTCLASYDLGHQLSVGVFVQLFWCPTGDAMKGTLLSCFAQGCAWRVSREGVHLLALVPNERKLLAVTLPKITELSASPQDYEPGDDEVRGPSGSGDEADVDRNETNDTLHPLSDRKPSGIAGPGGVRVSSSVSNFSATPVSSTSNIRNAITPEFRSSVGHPPLATSNFSLYGDGHVGGIATHRPKFSTASASGSMGHLKNISSAHSFGTQSSGEDIGLPVQIREPTSVDRYASSKLAQTSSGKHGSSAVISNGHGIAVPVTELQRPVPPYKPGDRYPFRDLLVDQPPIPSPRFCGGRFSIGGHLVVFSNVHAAVVSIGEGQVCEVPSTMNVVSLWNDNSTQERLEAHLSITARVRLMNVVC